MTRISKTPEREVTAGLHSGTVIVVESRKVVDGLRSGVEHARIMLTRDELAAIVAAVSGESPACAVNSTQA